MVCGCLGRKPTCQKNVDCPKVSCGIFWYLLNRSKRYQKIPGIFWTCSKDTKRYQVSFEHVQKIPGIFWYLLNRFKRYQKIPGIFWYLLNRFKRYQKIPKDTTRYHMMSQSPINIKKILPQPFVKIRVLYRVWP